MRSAELVKKATLKVYKGAIPDPLTLSARIDQMFPTLTPSRVARIAAHGRRRPVLRGEVLIEAGAGAVPFFVVTAGQIEIGRPSGTGTVLVAAHGPGQFTGEVEMLSGRRALVAARVSESGEVIGLDREHMLALVQTDGELSEILQRLSCVFGTQEIGCVSQTGFIRIV
jgi:thioredoxin reductase (NADPH)